MGTTREMTKMTIMALATTDCFKTRDLLIGINGQWRGKIASFQVECVGIYAHGCARIDMGRLQTDCTQLFS